MSVIILLLRVRAKEFLALLRQNLNVEQKRGEPLPKILKTRHGENTCFGAFVFAAVFQQIWNFDAIRIQDLSKNGQELFDILRKGKTEPKSVFELIAKNPFSS